MTERPKILCVCDCDDATPCVPEALRLGFDVVVERDPLKAFARLAEEKFAGVYVVSPHLSESLQVGRLLQNEQILVGMPDGVVLLDPENVVLWGNPQFRQWCGGRDIVGSEFLHGAGQSPKFSVPTSVRSPRLWPRARPAVPRCGSARTSSMKSMPPPCSLWNMAPLNLIVTIRDITEEKLQQQKLAAIHKAGVELTNLTPEEVFQMEVEDRIELLKSNILHYTKNLLNFDVIEIRLLDQEIAGTASPVAGGHETGCGPASAVCPSARQRRDRFRGRDRQELPVRRHA